MWVRSLPLNSIVRTRVPAMLGHLTEHNATLGSGHIQPLVADACAPDLYDAVGDEVIERRSPCRLARFLAHADEVIE
jgi:hypothetical protein